MGSQQPARPRALRLRARRERELAALADRQHGLLAREQLLKAGLSSRTIRRWLESGRLHAVHRAVYAHGSTRLTQKGEWLAAVLACGKNAVLSHRSAAALWGLSRHRLPVEVSGRAGRRRTGIAVHESGLKGDETTVVDGIPVTTVARTLLDVAEVEDGNRFSQTFEEAERLGLLKVSELELVCARAIGRHGLRPLRELIEAARLPGSRSPLESRVTALCRDRGLPMPQTNVLVLGREVDAFWPDHGLMVEADGYAYHRHRAAFERDRARDAAMQVAGYRVLRLTHRRLDQEPDTVAAQLRELLRLGRAAP